MVDAFLNEVKVGNRYILNRENYNGCTVIASVKKVHASKVTLEINYMIITTWSGNEEEMVDHTVESIKYYEDLMKSYPDSYKKNDLISDICMYSDKLIPYYGGDLSKLTLIKPFNEEMDDLKV